MALGRMGQGAPGEPGSGVLRSFDSVKIVPVAQVRCTKTIQFSTPWKRGWNPSRTSTVSSPARRTVMPSFVTNNFSPSGLPSAAKSPDPVFVSDCAYGLLTKSFRNRLWIPTTLTPRRPRAPFPGSSGKALACPGEGFSVIPGPHHSSKRGGWRSSRQSCRCSRSSV